VLAWVRCVGIHTCPPLLCCTTCVGAARFPGQHTRCLEVDQARSGYELCMRDGCACLVHEACCQSVCEAMYLVQPLAALLLVAHPGLVWVRTSQPCNCGRVCAWPRGCFLTGLTCVLGDVFVVYWVSGLVLCPRHFCDGVADRDLAAFGVSFEWCLLLRERRGLPCMPCSCMSGVGWASLGAGWWLCMEDVVRWLARS